MKIIKIIFLDIDGVLNKYNNNSIKFDFENDNIKTLKEIIFKTGALLVISSDWKKDKIDLFQKWDINLPMYIDSTNIINDTTLTKEKIRELEIKEWLKKYKNQYNIKYIVLDDMEIQIDNFIKVDPKKGLTFYNGIKAINILNN